MGRLMNSVGNRDLNGCRSRRLSVWYNRPFLLTVSSIISLAAGVLVLFVSFVNPFNPVIAYAGGNKEFAELVDIGGHRKMHLECRGTGSPTVVLISGTRGAHDDWTDLIDSKNPNSAPRPNEGAVFPEVSKFARVCVYDRPGTTLNDNTRTRSRLYNSPPTTAQQRVVDVHA